MLKTTSHEWKLEQRMLNLFFLQWGRPELDVFATPPPHTAPNSSSSQVGNAIRGLVNAFSIAWYGIFAYDFPPIPLLPKVLRKMKAEPCQILLIAPAWPRQHWYTELLLPVPPPIRLPHC